LKETTEVIKASAAIQIQNNITLLQRRAWTVLLANAYDELPTNEEYKMRVKDLIQVLEFDSKNQNYLKESLEALSTCGVKWNILDKDNSWEWGVTTLLSEARIKNGVCTYSYGPTLRKRLHNPTMYARISLSLQNQFDSKHSLALWELFIDYLVESKNYGETPFMPLEQYRELMGISSEMYPLFKLFNQRVIKEPIAEINRKTDFNVTVEYQRKSRKVVAVKFKIRRELQIPGNGDVQASLFPDDEDQPPIVRELKQAGLAARDAWSVWQQGFDYVDDDMRPTGIEFDVYIREKIHLLMKQGPGKIKNRKGFLLQAIRKNYDNPEFGDMQQEIVIVNHRLKVDKLHQELERTIAQRDETIHQICEKFLSKTQDILDEIMEKVATEDKFLYQQFYDKAKTSIDNYREHPFLAARVDAFFVELHPKKFNVVQRKYNNKIKAINRDMDTLKSSQ